VPAPKDAWEFYAGDIYRFRPPRMSHQVIYLDGKPIRRRPSEAGRGIAQLKPVEWCLHEGYVYFCVENGRAPRQYDLSYTSLTVGITLYEVRHVLSAMCRPRFQLDGVNAHDGVLDTNLVGLTCRGNGRSGISVGGLPVSALTACLVGDNGEAQVRTEGVSRTPSSTAISSIRPPRRWSARRLVTMLANAKNAKSLSRLYGRNQRSVTSFVGGTGSAQCHRGTHVASQNTGRASATHDRCAPCALVTMSDSSWIPLP